MFYLESNSKDAAFNLALEQYVFDSLSNKGDFFMLWQNENAAVIGLHQNTLSEINTRYADAEGIQVIRRLSGGGAVYHDTGNLNFTFISRSPTMPPLDSTCQPILYAIQALGIPAVLRGRNDLTIGERKFSGNAWYYKNNRLLHHGTLLFNTNLTIMSEVLRVSDDKIRSKAIPSIRSRVTNIKEHLLRDMNIGEFWAHIRRTMGENISDTYTLSHDDLNAVNLLKNTRYATREWNYGRSPDYAIQKYRTIPGVGTIYINLDIKNGRIDALSSHGDYFGSKSYAELSDLLHGLPYDKDCLLQHLSNVPLQDYYEGLTTEEFVLLITQ